MKCGLCKEKIVEGKCSYIWIDRKLSVYCRKCSPKIEKMSNLPEVMVVPVSPKNFSNILKSNVYSHPVIYGRRGGKYIAFYISSPKSHITHFSRVKLIIKNNEKKIYFLEKLALLKKPIVRGDRQGIQGTQNTTLKRLNSAKHIKEL